MRRSLVVKQSLAKFLAIIMLTIPVLSMAPPAAFADESLDAAVALLESIESTDTAPVAPAEPVEPEVEIEAPEVEADLESEAPAVEVSPETEASDAESDQKVAATDEAEEADIEELDEEVEELEETLTPGRYRIPITMLMSDNLSNVSSAFDNFYNHAIIDVAANGT
ncbi:MAG: hypothetical protein FWC86_06520, partial [Coriobacteriia bacterium]|nr:hypothetical protein [Coriobacteriia bacterium]